MSTLTTALESGTFTKVDFVAKTDADAVAADYSDLTGNLFGKLGAPDVSATKPTFTGEGTDSAKSTLTWAWGLPGGRWTYESEVELRKTGEKWEFVWEPTVVAPALAEGRSLHVETVHQQRGEIRSTSGATLVADRPVVTVGIDKTLIDPVAAPAAARDVAAIVGINPKRYAKRVKAAGDKAFVEALSIRKPMMTKAKAAEIAKIKGAAMLNRTLPLGPTKEFASPVVGIVGEVTAEMMKKKPGTTFRAISPASPDCRRATTGSCGGSPGCRSRSSVTRVRCSRSSTARTRSTGSRWPSRSTRGCRRAPRRS